MRKLLAILGPTTTGKTNLALFLAKKFNGELVACDSRQVYKGLDVGTGKMPSRMPGVRFQKSDRFWKVDGVRIWLYDVVNLRTQYTVSDYVQEGKKVVEEIFVRERLPIIVGGTGLYLKGLLEGFNSLEIPINRSLRRELQELSTKELQSRIVTLSPTKWQNLNDSDRKNPRRLIRIIEQISMYGYTKRVQNSKSKIQNCDVLKVGLTAPRPFLNSKIDQQVLFWLEHGIIEEVQGLRKKGITLKRFKDLGLEYALIAEYLRGEISSKEELTKLMKVKIRQYAKRQVTWFKKEKGVIWFDVSQPNLAHRVETVVTNWYNSNKDQEVSDNKL